MQTSENITELIKALVNAQREFEPVKRTVTNSFFHSKYATLDDVLAACVPILVKCGLTVLQPIETLESGETIIETRLLHVSGEWLSSKVKIPILQQKGANALQEFGIGITYMRRYMLSSLLGMSTEDDNDGNNASTQRPKKEPEAKATQEQKAQITKAIKDLGLTDVDKALKDAHFVPLAQLTESQAKSAIERLEKAVKAKKDAANAET